MARVYTGSSSEWRTSELTLHTQETFAGGAYTLYFKIITLICSYLHFLKFHSFIYELKAFYCVKQFLLCALFFEYIYVFSLTTCLYLFILRKVQEILILLIILFVNLVISLDENP